MSRKTNAPYLSAPYFQISRGGKNDFHAFDSVIPLSKGIKMDWKELTRILICKGFNPSQTMSKPNKLNKASSMLH